MEGAGQRMKAAYTRYGPPDVVEVSDLDKLFPGTTRFMGRS